MTDLQRDFILRIALEKLTEKLIKQNQVDRRRKSRQILKVNK